MAYSAQLAKSFLRASSCRYSSLTRPLSTVAFTPIRRWRSTAALSADAEVAEAPEIPDAEVALAPTKRVRKAKAKPVELDTPGASDTQNSTADSVPAGVPKKRGRKPKVKVEEEADKEVDNKAEEEVGNKIPEDSIAYSELLPPRSPGVRHTPKKFPFDINKLHTRKDELPPNDQWSYFFPYMKETLHRLTIQNPETARMIAEAIVPKGSKGKIIIEAYPGAGLLSRALLALPKNRIKRLIVIEDATVFSPFIQPLADLDPRVTVINKAGKQWTTYSDMEADGTLSDVDTLPWDQKHDQLQFVMQAATDMHGEQLISQLLRAVPDRQWLFKYGRIPMSIVLTQRMWERLTAVPGTLTRCKVSAMAQAVATLHEDIPTEKLQPHADHFYPQRTGPTPVTQAVVTLTPTKKPLIPAGDLDIWDYCLRKLFVMRATPLDKCLGGLGPGAKNILPKLTDPSLPEEERVDTSKAPRQLDIREWSLVVKAFKNWPFRPADLSIESFSASRR